MTRRRWMALCFALGSACFPIGPFPGYAQLVVESADAITFFVGSILFTLSGALQSSLAWPDRQSIGGGRAAWWAAIIQSAGTLFFKVTTYQAMHTAVTSSEQQACLAARLAWVDLLRRFARYRLPRLTAPPLARLVAGARQRGMVAPAVNLLGRMFFGIAAVAGYVVPATGSMPDQAAADWNTWLGNAYDRGKADGPHASSSDASARRKCEEVVPELVQL